MFRLKYPLALLVFLLAAPQGLAHYNYPYSCCGQMDCGPIVNILMLPDGARRVTIRLQDGSDRATIFPAGMWSQPPIDDKDHACIGNDGMPMCLFLNGGA